MEGNLEKTISLRRALRKWMSRHKHAIARKQKVAFTKVYLTLRQEIIYVEDKSRNESQHIRSYLSVIVAYDWQDYRPLLYNILPSSKRYVRVWYTLQNSSGDHLGIYKWEILAHGSRILDLTRTFTRKCIISKCYPPSPFQQITFAQCQLAMIGKRTPPPPPINN